jgi:pyruvate formate lyase activating enzyme
MGRGTEGGILPTRTFRRKKQIEESFPIVNIRDLSIIDYPRKLCSVLTVSGCNFRCPFCPNEDLIYNSIPMKKIQSKQIIQRIYPRLKFLDGICISGGEPTLHKNLPSFLQELRVINNLIKIDTNGSRPKMLRILFDKQLLDYITMKILAPISKYKEVTRQQIDPAIIESSIQMIRKSKIPHDFRTTVVPGYHDMKTIEELVQSITGSRKFTIKQFDPSKTLDPECQKIQPYSESELRQIRDLIAPYFSETEIIY